MFLQRSSRRAVRLPSTHAVIASAARKSSSGSRPLSTRPAASLALTTTQLPRRLRKSAASSLSQPVSLARCFHASRRLQVVKPVLLADIGEGIVECEIIQWFVQPGARVEEFSPLCEVQSDKASVEITSRFTGVVKKLYYEAGDMAKVGKAFVDIDILDDGAADQESAAAGADEEPAAAPVETSEVSPSAAVPPPAAAAPPPAKKKFAGSNLATPAVRHLSKELDVDITLVDGTGKDGRVTKEDLYRYVGEKKAAAAEAEAEAEAAAPAQAPAPGAPAIHTVDAVQQETVVPISGMQMQMFKSMTRSLTIPHFLYADEIDFTQLYQLRKRVNASLARAAGSSGDGATVTRLSYLPFVVKALSVALGQYPILNARVDTTTDAAKPRLVYRSQHNIGIAMDTPTGLIVPVIHNVNARSVLSIAAELARLQALAMAGKLAPADLQGGTITVSNIGNVGGTYVGPVIVDREVAILGVGRMRTVPAFADDGSDCIIKRHVCNFSFSADHRVVDGATMARAAEVVREMVEQPDSMVLQLR